jgi:hypothetical protein
MRAPPRSVLVNLFSAVIIAPNGNAIGPAGGFDLTGFDNYRLSLRFDGAPGASFVINELFGPAGAIQQLNVDIDRGALDTLGTLNFRGRYEVFGPKAMHIRVFNTSAQPLRLSGSLYAVQL